MADTDTTHGPLFDRFSARPSHAHGGSMFDTGFGAAALNEAHGRLYDLFGAPKDNDAHGQRYDEFGWKDMPTIHGQLFDSDFQAPTTGDGGHGGSTWFDVFRGGRTQARIMVNGKDVEGVVIHCEPSHAVVKDHTGQTHEVDLSQFLAYRTPNNEQASPAIPESDAENPSVHSEARGGHASGDRAIRGTFDPAQLPSHVQELPQGEFRERRTEGVPEGLLDTFTHLKSLTAAPDVAKGIKAGGAPCTNCGHTLYHPNASGGSPGFSPKGKVECASCGTVHPSSVLGSTIKPGPKATPGGIQQGTSVWGKTLDVLRDLVAKDIGTTETAIQGSPTGKSAAKSVSHRSNCPRGGSEPCGADVDGKCSLCSATVRDHEAIGKAFGAAADAMAGGQSVTLLPGASQPDTHPATTDPPDVKIPKREHKASDHHMRLGATPGTCPHCGEVIEQLDHQTEQGQPSRKEKQGSSPEFSTVTAHKCVGTGLDILKTSLGA